MPHKTYELDGKTYPSVTEILAIIAKPGLMTWANSLGLAGKDNKTESQRIAGIGTAVHAQIESYFREGKPFYEGAPKEARYPLKLFAMWLQKHEIEPVLIEESLISPALGFAGTIDLLAKVDGRLTLIDFKTSTRIYGDYYAQLSAYKQLLAERGFVPEAMLIVRLGKEKDISFEEQEVSNEELYYKYFEKALELYKAMKNIEKL